MKRIGGNRRKTRAILRKGVRQRGKISITRYLQAFDQGDKVLLKAEPAVQGGMYFRRFHSKHGVIIAKQGECYKVAIKDGGLVKYCIVHPSHLKKV